MRDVFDEMKRMQHEMDRMFDGFFRGPKHKLLGSGKEGKELEKRAPVTDIYETDNEVVAKIEMPGIDKKDIKLNVTDNAIEVKAEKKKENEVKKEGFYRCERGYSGFYRAMPLPAEIDADKAKAKMKEGVLEIRAPKTKQVKGKTLQIE